MQPTFYQADVMAWAKQYEGEPAHAILCDPPYELNFMNRGWDNSGIAFRPEFWAAYYDLLLPGAFGFAFASTRGYHRMACAIEDAGFIIHPMICYAFGAGFPKATRIDTQIDAAAGVDGERVIVENASRKRSMSFSMTGGGQATYTPATELAQAWQGHRYGLQAMKPALEPICVFQRPYDGKPVDCMVRTGAGALNIDAGRIGTEQVEQGREGRTQRPGYDGGWKDGSGGYATGRWPANLILGHSAACTEHGCAADCAVEAMGRQSGETPIKTKVYEVKECCVNAIIAELNSMHGPQMFSGATEGFAAGNAGQTAGESQAKRTQRDGSIKEMGVGIVNGERPEADTYINNSNTDGCGKWQTAPFQGGVKSTTETTINKTMNCPTCNSYLHLNTTTTISGCERIITSEMMVQRCDVASGVRITSRLVSSARDVLELITAIANRVNWNTSASGGGNTPTINVITCASGNSDDSANNPARYFQQTDWELEKADPFFYTAKASTAEREAGLEHLPLVEASALTGRKPGSAGLDGNRELGYNHNPLAKTTTARRNTHPTLKPLSLTRYLASLLLPPDAYAPRRLLVPFSGSGSEAIGAMLAGWDEIHGIELSAEYCEIARARASYWYARREQAKHMKLQVAKSKPMESNQVSMFDLFNEAA